MQPDFTEILLHKMEPLVGDGTSVVHEKVAKIHRSPVGGFDLYSDEIEAYNEAFRFFVKKSEWAEKFSEKYLKSVFDRILTVLLQGDRAAAATEIENAVDELQSYNTSYSVYVRIDGIELRMDSLDVGRVTIRKVDEEYLSELIRQTKDVVNKTRHTSAEKESIGTQLRGEFRKHLLGNVVAEYSVVAEPQHARNRAIDETRRAIDALRFVIPGLYPLSYKVAIGLCGEICCTSRLIPAISSENINTNIERIGPLSNFVVNQDNLERIRKLGLDSISQILKKEKPSDFESALMRGVHWVSMALTQSELENQVLNLITAIEVVLTPDDGNPISTAIAEGVAILLADGASNRIGLKKEVKRLYGLRSCVSHGGHKQILETDVTELLYIVLNLMHTLLVRTERFQSRRELLSWIEEQKMG